MLKVRFYSKLIFDEFFVSMLSSLKINYIRNIYQQRKASKAAIRNILGENTIVRRNFDPGRFEGIAEIFGKKKKLFKTAELQNNKVMNINYVGCFYNNQRELKNIYIYNRDNKNVDIFTKSGELIQQYTPEETLALFTYKRDSRNIHKALRGNKKLKKEKLEKINAHIKTISNMFKNNKVLKTTEEVVTYRALDKTSLKKILSLKEGDVFTVASFTSVATKKNKILQFLGLRNFLHPAKIKLPKDTKYISMDELHNIVMPNEMETELLLQEGSSFVITKKPKIGFIEMELLTK